MTILDTPQWKNLTQAQKNLVNNISGNDTGEGYSTNLTTATAKVAEALEEKGLITVEWGDQHNKRLHPVTLRLKEEGWSV